MSGAEAHAVGTADVRRELLRRARDARREYDRAYREWGAYDEDGECARAWALQEAYREAARLLRGVA